MSKRQSYYFPDSALVRQQRLKQRFRKGQRVQLHPGMDLWMRGDRYGTVSRPRFKGGVLVKMDKSQRSVIVPEDRLELVD